MRGPGEIVAALVAAPVQQHFARLHAAIELRAVFAIHRREHVVFLHRAADRDVRGFVAEARGVRAELAGALQRDRLAVEDAHEQHQLVELDQLLDVARERRQIVADELAVRVEILQVFDLESGGDRHETSGLRRVGADGIDARPAERRCEVPTRRGWNSKQGGHRRARPVAAWPQCSSLPRIHLRASLTRLSGDLSRKRER